MKSVAALARMSLSLLLVGFIACGGKVVVDGGQTGEGGAGGGSTPAEILCARWRGVAEMACGPQSPDFQKQCVDPLQTVDDECIVALTAEIECELADPTIALSCDSQGLLTISSKAECPPSGPHCD